MITLTPTPLIGCWAIRKDGSLDEASKTPPVSLKPMQEERAEQ